MFSLIYLYYVLFKECSRTSPNGPKLCKEQLCPTGADNHFISAQAARPPGRDPTRAEPPESCFELAPKRKVNSTGTRWRSRWDKSPADSETFPYSGILCAVLVSKEDSTGKNYLEHKFTGVTDDLEEQTVIWETAIQDPCPRPLNASQYLKSNLSIKNPKAIEKRAVMISNETSRVWPKAL